MIHTLQGLLSTLVNDVSAHLAVWDGWAVLTAAVLFGFRAASLWMPLVVALIINPTPYGIVAGLVHGRAAGINGFATFTLVQALIGYAGYGLGRLAIRLR